MESAGPVFFDINLILYAARREAFYKSAGHFWKYFFQDEMLTAKIFFSSIDRICTGWVRTVYFQTQDKNTYEDEEFIKDNLAGNAALFGEILPAPCGAPGFFCCLGIIFSHRITVTILNYSLICYVISV